MQVNICQQIPLPSIPEASEKWFVIKDKSDHQNGGRDTLHMGPNGEFYSLMCWSPTRTGGKYFDTREEAESCVNSFGYEIVEEEIYEMNSND